MMGLRNRLPAHLAKKTGVKTSLWQMLLGPRLAGTRLVPCGMLAPAQQHPVPGSITLAFGRILDALRLSEDCQHLDKAGGFSPKTIFLF